MRGSDEGDITRILSVLEEAGYEDVLVLDQESADKVLTERRRELIDQIESMDAQSVSELATQLNRKKSAVSRDLSVLYEYNVINFEREGKRKIPILKHESIMTKPMVIGGDLEDTTTTTTDTRDDTTGQLDSEGEPSEHQYDADALSALVSQIDSYEFDSVINIGRFGATTKVIRETGDIGVLKTVSGPDSEESRLLIECEIAALKRVGDHQHIISLLDSGTEPQPWLVTEYAPYGTLQESFPLQISAGIDVVQQIIDAMLYAHSMSIPHGDLKPSNIILNTEPSAPQVRIIDWGTALASLDTSESSLFLTRAYAPPELVGSESASSSTTTVPRDSRQDIGQSEYERIDIYQLGKIVYDILTSGYPAPSHTASGDETTAEVLPPSAINQSLPQELDDVVLKALAADPDDRYQTIEAFWNELEPVIEKYGL